MEKIIIAAVSDNLVIGKNGKVPWHSKEELNFFKVTTMGYPLIMGRKTFDSIGKPLPGRLNVVLTRNKNISDNYSGIIVFNKLDEAIHYCESEVKAEKVFIIGGGEIISEAIHIADKLSISFMNVSTEGDTYFPAINENIWCEEDTINYNDFKLKLYKRCVK